MAYTQSHMPDDKNMDFEQFPVGSQNDSPIEKYGFTSESMLNSMSYYGKKGNNNQETPNGLYYRPDLITNHLMTCNCGYGTYDKNEYVAHANFCPNRMR